MANSTLDFLEGATPFKEKGKMTTEMTSRASQEIPSFLEGAVPFKKEKNLEKIQKGLKFYGWKPELETVEKARHMAATGTKGLFKGMLGIYGDLIALPQRLAGKEKPITGLPTSETIGNIYDKLLGEEFNPRNLSEEVLSKGADFLGASLGLGGIGGATLPKTVGRNLLGAFVPAGVSVFTEKAKLPPWIQVGATLGTSFLTHRLTGKGLKDIERGLYNKASELGKDVEVSAKNLKPQIENIITNLKKGGIESSDKEALRKLADIKDSIKGGKISVENLMALKRKINEARGQLFTKDLGRIGVKSARKKLNEVSRLLDRTIGTYKNPEFQKVFREANQLHGGIIESNRLINWMMNNKTLTGSAGFLVKSLLPAWFGKGIAGIAGIKTLQMIKALAKYPAYRRAYWNILKNASKEELKGTVTAVKKFNQETKKIIPEMEED